MPRFRTKPIEVEAEQFTSEYRPAGVCIDTHTDRPIGITGLVPHVHTAQGERVLVKFGEWIITGSNKRGFYPCAPDIFGETYTRVE